MFIHMYMCVLLSFKVKCFSIATVSEQMEDGSRIQLRAGRQSRELREKKKKNLPTACN